MISRNMRVNGELGLRIVLELGVCVQEAAQPGDLGGEVHDDDLHLDIEIQSQDLFASLQCLCACRDEHVAFETEGLDRVDHLAEF